MLIGRAARTTSPSLGESAGFSAVLRIVLTRHVSAAGKRADDGTLLTIIGPRPLA
jgi:hypothetical protein